MPSEKKQNFILEIILKIRLITFRDVSIIPNSTIPMLNLVGGLSSLRSKNFCRHSKLKVQLLAHINPIALLYKKILAEIMLLF